MSPEERSIELELLEQRWPLIQSGINYKFIKIKKGLYVRNKLYGTNKNSKFVMVTEHSDVMDQPTTASTNNVSVSVETANNQSISNTIAPVTETN